MGFHPKNTHCVCRQCGKPFSITTSEAKRGGGQYCSRQCSSAYRSTKIEHHCENCGKLFLATRRREKAGLARFCSKECFNSKRNTQTEICCKYCGKYFKVKIGRINEKAGYCSQECYHNFYRGENHSWWAGGYSKFRGENWGNQRKLAYQRDGGICQICGQKPKKGKRKNAVHHIRKFRSFNGDYLSANDLTNLITLCQKCHMKAEHGLISVPKYLF